MSYHAQQTRANSRDAVYPSYDRREASSGSPQQQSSVDNRHHYPAPPPSAPRPFADPPASLHMPSSTSSSPNTSHRMPRALTDPYTGTASLQQSRSPRHSRSGSVSTVHDSPSLDHGTASRPPQTYPFYNHNHGHSAPGSSSSLTDPYSPAPTVSRPSFGSDAGRPVAIDIRRLRSKPAPTTQDTTYKTSNLSRTLDSLSPRSPLLGWSDASERQDLSRIPTWSQNGGTKARASEDHEVSRERTRGLLDPRRAATVPEDGQSESSRDVSPIRPLLPPHRPGERNRPSSTFREMQDALFGGRHVNGEPTSSDHGHSNIQDQFPQSPYALSPVPAPRQRNVLKRKPSVTATANPRGAMPAVSTEPVFGHHSQRPDPSHPMSLASPVTPASAVLQAYKERGRVQESVSKQREKLDGTPRVSKDETVLPTREGWDGNSSGRPAVGNDQDVSLPFYTVFGGGASSRVVAVGSPTDGTWKTDIVTQDRSKYLKRDLQRERKRSISPAHVKQGSHVGHGAGGLVRKVSGRWKRSGSASDNGHETTDHAYGGMETPDTRPRQSLQHEHRSATLPRPRPPSLRLSMDSYVDVQKENAIPNTRQPLVGTWVEVERSVKDRGLTEKRRDRMSEDGGMGGGGKLWRLMKRLSSGTLKDRYQADGTPPPVPALPMGLKSTTRANTEPTTTHLETPVSRRDTPLHDSPANRSISLSAVQQSSRPNTSTPQKSLTGVARPSGPRPSTSQSSPKDMAPPRRSTNTQESSSSPTTDSHLFHNPPSNRSSISSYGNEVARPAVDKHIMSPSEVFNFDKAQEERVLAERSSTKPPPNVHLGTQCTLSLPPPRRPSANASSRSGSSQPRSDPPSPTMMTFSIQDTVNSRLPPPRPHTFNHSHGKEPSDSSPSRLEINSTGSSSHHQSMPPPPRPARSPHRPSGHGGLVSAVTPNVPFPATRLDEDGRGRADSPKLQGPRARSASQTRRRSPPRSNPKPSSSGSTRSKSMGGQATFLTTPLSALPPPTPTPVQFRKLDVATLRTALTEQQKAEKWDSLLEMSARAGGTLHVGGEEGLLSDNLRLSTISGVSGATMTDG